MFGEGGFDVGGVCGGGGVVGGGVVDGGGVFSSCGQKIHHHYQHQK